MGGRYRAYTIFDWTGILYLILGFLALGMVWALGSGEASWNSLQASLQNPLMILFHVVALVGVCFVVLRFFRLFPKAQPPRLGPVKPPPAQVISIMLYAVWIGVTVVFAVILSGGLS